jgi:demethylmenaquinone methyltransferase/2-methoxy-6-polyprenyl-1,4-benzoquinol methylase
MAGSARVILAVDAVEEMLEVARGKEYPAGRVRFRVGDAFRLEEIDGHFSIVVAAFLWSHLPRRELPLWLDGLTRRFSEGVTLWLTDNRYAEGSSTPIARRDAQGNSWQTRRLADGSEFEIMKNFPTPEELTAVIRPYAREVEIRLLDYFWIVKAELRGLETVDVEPA